MGGVDLVLSTLESAGFEVLPKPLVVGGTKFEFDAAVVGTEHSHDLVVIGGIEVFPERLERLLSGLNRTLDRLGSQRPVSLVLIGPRPERRRQASLEGHARVMLIEDEEPSQQLVNDAISILLPLDIPPTSAMGAPVSDDLEDTLGSAITEEHRILIAAGEDGPSKVEEALAEYIGAILDPPSAD